MIGVSSFAIGLVGSVAGVGGGVLFTPLFLALTNLHVDVVRATGLALAFTTSIVAGRKFLSSETTNLGLVLFSAAALAPTSLLGAATSLYIVKALGKTGEAYIRISLGLIMILAIIVMVMRRTDRQARKPSPLAQRLGLVGSYSELGTTAAYGPTNLLIGALLLGAVGFMSGAFGLGGGWAMVPILSIVMGLPLRVAAATSVASIALGEIPGLWRYIKEGALLPEMLSLVVPAAMLGSSIGARLALRVKAPVIRYAVIGVLAVASMQLIQRGLAGLWTG